MWHRVNVFAVQKRWQNEGMRRTSGLRQGKVATNFSGSGAGLRQLQAWMLKGFSIICMRLAGRFLLYGQNDGITWESGLLGSAMDLLCDLLSVGCQILLHLTSTDL